MPLDAKATKQEISLVLSRDLATALTKFEKRCEQTREFLDAPVASPISAANEMRGAADLEAAGRRRTFDSTPVAIRLKMAAGLTASTPERPEDSAQALREARLVGGLARTLARGFVDRRAAA